MTVKKSDVITWGVAFVFAILFWYWYSGCEQKYEARKKTEETAKVEKCRAEAACWGLHHMPAAVPKCRAEIEKNAKYSFRWKEGDVLEKAGWKDQESLKVSYFGDNVQFQNGFGAWQDMLYQCDYDTRTGRVLEVKVQPGRF